mmetsp:Transcript_26305/g.45241  ORF Transcript_26305/g.45241 Transcript_26305/m.45241 type:complete len:228 (+) Transcript_26305:128-811(+)|eukprot:CAMPEP_0196660662 /NCGR_PEP_ID=MMETSP1086-20130531/40819_1 /TAXON_ID=77921 /ORGANISM="Cyanoptyche  gloeocystis , Strain SAG4.97" /LENGTH=227 /DNA_ID=CAMNT_0041995197 /DNA_START=127 /DNA_END=810 /DNA_ORIENTATION=-
MADINQGPWYVDQYLAQSPATWFDETELMNSISSASDPVPDIQVTSESDEISSDDFRNFDSSSSSITWNSSGSDGSPDAAPDTFVAESYLNPTERSRVARWNRRLKLYSLRAANKGVVAGYPQTPGCYPQTPGDACRTPLPYARVTGKTEDGQPPKRQKSLQSTLRNREAAARARDRLKTHMSDLMAKLAKLEQENTMLRTELANRAMRSGSKIRPFSGYSNAMASC